MHAISKKPVLKSLSDFDSLPDTANVRQPIVEALYGCSSATVWRWVKKGIIPAPKKFAEQRITVWNVGELRSSLNTNIKQEINPLSPRRV